MWCLNGFHFRSARFSALKVVKSAPHYTETALDEIKLLKCVSILSDDADLCIQYIFTYGQGEINDTALGSSQSYQIMTWRTKVFFFEYIYLNHNPTLIVYFPHYCI